MIGLLRARKLRRLPLTIIFCWGLILGASCSQKPPAGTRYIDSPLVPEGQVTLVELGSLSCKPCQMMMPIIDDLERAYSGRAVVRFINVHEVEGAARTFGIMAIPTQILYDRDRKELFRHTGFIEKEYLEKEIDSALKGS